MCCAAGLPSSSDLHMACFARAAAQSGIDENTFRTDSSIREPTESWSVTTGICGSA